MIFRDMISRILPKCRYLNPKIHKIHNNVVVDNLGKFSGVQLQTFRTVVKMTFSEEVDHAGKPSEIERYLKASKFPLEKGFTCWRCLCPISPTSSDTTKKSPIHSKPFFVNIKTGMFINYEQRISGTWRTFQDFLDVLRGIRSDPVVTTQSDVFLRPDQYQEIEDIFNAAQKVENLPLSEFNSLCKKFNLKGLLLETFRFYDVRVSDDRNSLLFPFYDPTRKLSGVKRITTSISEHGEKHFSDIFTPHQSILSIFGGNKTSQWNQDQVVLVGSVLDAMTVAQETNILTVALPKKGWPLSVEILPWFEKFTRITLWLGSSLADWELTKTLARKLGIQRCFFVRYTDFPFCALESLQKGNSVLKIISQAEAVSHKFITDFISLKGEVLQELCHSQEVAGITWTRFPALNKLLKGHRRGELTIFTGPTGSGKTTFMSEYSLDLCMQGVITLWGSFEIRNVRLAKLMITQFSQTPLESNVEKFETWSEQFEQLPLFFMTLHGQHNVTKVLQIMAHAVYVHDIQHVIVDNLQFMMGMDTVADRFHRQDLIVAAFRKFATQNNCHVTLVMHPRKENNTDELTINSISGGAKASQEADNIIILQDRKVTEVRRRKYIQVTKNRFDGDIGAFPIEFDKETKTFTAKRRLRKVPTADDDSSK